MQAQRAVLIRLADECEVGLSVGRTSQTGYSQLTVVPWLIKVFTPRVGRRCAAGYGLDSERDCGSHGRSA